MLKYHDFYRFLTENSSFMLLRAKINLKVEVV